MAVGQIHGTNVVLQIFSSLSSGSIDASGDFNSATLRWDRNNAEVTTFSNLTVQRISGIKDYTLDFAGIFRAGTTCPLSHLVADMNASLPTQFKLAPGGSVSGSPVFSGCCFISTMSITGPQNGPVAMSFSLQSGAGSLTAACIA